VGGISKKQVFCEKKARDGKKGGKSPLQGKKKGGGIPPKNEKRYLSFRGKKGRENKNLLLARKPIPNSQGEAQKRD